MFCVKPTSVYTDRVRQTGPNPSFDDQIKTGAQRGRRGQYGRHLAVNLPPLRLNSRGDLGSPVDLSCARTGPRDWNTHESSDGDARETG